MCWRIVDVKVRFLDTLAMVSLGIAQAKQSLLQKVVLLVPEGKCHILQTVSVTDPSNAVLTPPICS